MKKNLFLMALAMASFAFTANAQSCSNSTAKASCCAAKKTTTAAKSSTTGEAKAVAVSNLQSDDVTIEEFTVYGNCGMCERRIEAALSTTKGIQSADWNVDTKVLTVQFDAAIISKEEIQQTIAKAGHDTDEFRADQKIYDSLPGCCQYERPASKAD